MSKLKLKLDITCLIPRQRRRIFVKEYNRICQMTATSKNLEVQNIVSESNGPDVIEQPQQQNVLKEINFDYFNVIDTDENNDELTFVHSEVNTDEDSLQSNISDEGISKTEIINDIRLWAIENRVNHSTISNLLKILVKYGHELPMDARTLFKTPK
jgi:hypothetical protein